MTDKNKPEWFDIAENDGPAVPSKPSKSLPLAAILAAGLIIGIGAVIAQTQEEPPANATETSSVANDQGNSTSQTPSEASTPSTTPSTTESPKSPSSPTKEAIANPNITKLPTGGREGEHEGDEHHGPRPPHHEGGEHEFEGDDD